MTKKRIFLTICTAVTAALIFAQIDEFGATWDEFLYFKGVRGVINHGLEILGATVRTLMRYLVIWLYLDT